MKQLVAKKATLGDAAVDGLLGGVAAGFAMAVALVGLSLLGGEGLAVLNRFDPNGASLISGGLLHLAVSGVYGAVFGIGEKYVRQMRVPSWLLGTLYGLVLFGLAEIILATGNRSALAEIPFLIFGIAHLIYGWVLGWTMERIRA